MNPEATWLDRAIMAVAPARGLKRIEARTRAARITKIRNLYEAASLSRRTSGWRSVSTDANAETLLASHRLRDVARDMVRNNAYAARGKMVLTNDVVGAGIVPRVRASTPKRADKVKGLITSHLETTAIDSDGRHNLYGLQALAFSTIVEAGEVLIRRRPRRAEHDLPLPFQLQVLEPDFLDTSFEGPQSNGNYCVQGVEFNLIGQRVAYYLHDVHPGAMRGGLSNNGSKGQRVSAQNIAHVYRVDRPGQVRGVTWFSPVIMRLRDFADYTDAQLVRQKIAACFAAFITTGEGFQSEGGADAVSTSGYPIEQFEPGMIERLREGEQVTFATPPSTQDFGGYSNVTLHEVAVGLGTTYEALTGDLSQVNYSSGRMGHLQYQRNIEAWRWNMIVPQMLDRISAWTQEAAAVATGSSEPFSMSWTPPRREMIDPDTEIRASVASIRAGLTSRSEEIRRFGFDADEIDAEIASDNARADELGLAFDSDPRRMTTRGVAQKDADPNAADVPTNDRE